MKKIILSVVVLLFAGVAFGETWKGTWVTTKGKRLHGTMTCDSKDLGGDRWSGRFHGVWQGVRFSYNVNWSGPPNNMRGTAFIDGVNYNWTGKMSGNRFTGEFASPRYDGYFDLKK